MSSTTRSVEMVRKLLLGEDLYNECKQNGGVITSDQLDQRVKHINNRMFFKKRNCARQDLIDVCALSDVQDVKAIEKHSSCLSTIVKELLHAVKPVNRTSKQTKKLLIDYIYENDAEIVKFMLDQDVPWDHVFWSYVNEKDHPDIYMLAIDRGLAQFYFRNIFTVAARELSLYKRVLRHPKLKLTQNDMLDVIFSLTTGVIRGIDNNDANSEENNRYVQKTIDNLMYIMNNTLLDFELWTPPKDEMTEHQWNNMSIDSKLAYLKEHHKMVFARYEGSRIACLNTMLEAIERMLQQKEDLEKIRMKNSLIHNNKYYTGYQIELLKDRIINSPMRHLILEGYKRIGLNNPKYPKLHQLLHARNKEIMDTVKIFADTLPHRLVPSDVQKYVLNEYLF
jgi:hypothetical protein